MENVCLGVHLGASVKCVHSNGYRSVEGWYRSICMTRKVFRRKETIMNIFAWTLSLGDGCHPVVITLSHPASTVTRKWF
jgi:hypothetical protein